MSKNTVCMAVSSRATYELHDRGSLLESRLAGMSAGPTTEEATFEPLPLVTARKVNSRRLCARARTGIRAPCSDGRARGARFRTGCGTERGAWPCTRQHARELRRPMAEAPLIVRQ